MKGRIHTFLLFFVVSALSASAQGTQGFEVAGVVHDGTGSVIPGASVAVKLEGTIAAIAGQTDDEGKFQISVSGAGSFQVEVNANGFEAYRITAAPTVQTPVANLDVTLKVSGTAETVEVTADALAAETTSTQLGETLGSQKD